ncbi:MAG: response regulator [Pseudomonadota bacterium]
MKTILIVDDHSDIRLLLRVTLGKTYNLLEAADGPTGLRIVREKKPDLVVLDVTMPGELDGLGVLDAIKSDPQLATVKVIMLSARGQARDYDMAIRRGADEYIIKPFSPMQLFNSIETLIAI